MTCVLTLPHEVSGGIFFNELLTRDSRKGFYAEASQISVVERPIIASVQEQGSTFRLKLNGSHFQEGAQVFIAADTSA